MLSLGKPSKQSPLAEPGDFQLAFSTAMNVMAALSNHVTAAATVSAAAAAGYSGLTAPPITAKASGKFLVMAALTISDNAGSLVDTDGVSYQLLRGATPIGPVMLAAASTSGGLQAGSAKVALCSVPPFIDSSGAAIGATTTYALKIVSTNSHTSGVVATTDGNITVLELPG